jgi:hypothetical protein
MSLSQLRPLAFGEILDGAFALYRRHFSVFVPTSLLAHAPLMLLWAAYAVVGGDASPDAPLFSFPSRILATLGAILAFGAATRQASAAYLGGEVSLQDGLRTAWERFRPVWASIVIQGLAVFLGFVLLVLPGIYFFITLFALVPAVVLEGMDSTQAQKRSKELARGAWKQVFGVMAVFFMLSWIPVLAIAIVLGMAMGAAHAGGLSDGVMNLAITLASAVAIPLQATGTVLLYYDRRVRTEALDLELAPEPAAAAAF